MTYALHKGGRYLRLQACATGRESRALFAFLTEHRCVKIAKSTCHILRVRFSTRKANATTCAELDPFGALGKKPQALHVTCPFRATGSLVPCMDVTRSATDAPASDRPSPTARPMRSCNGCMTCMRVVRHGTSGACKDSSAHARARLRAVPFGPP